MKKLIFIFLCLCITFNLYSLDVSALEIEYMELLQDLGNYGPQGTIPYYTDSQYYNSTDRYIVNVDNDLVFAIIESGFLKFIDAQGIRYSRYLWLYKHPEGYLVDGLLGRCADEFFKTDREGYYSVTAYLPAPGTNIKREGITIKMDEVIPVERTVVARHLNTSMINLVYTVNRMIEIAYILKQTQTGFSNNYEFKIRTLEKILDLVIEDCYEFDRECRNREVNKQPITQMDFINMHPNLESIYDMLPFLKLER